MTSRWLIVVILVSASFGNVSAQCTFTSTFASTSWHDNTRGTLAFGTTTMSGWTFEAVFTTGVQTISRTWSCVNNTDDSYIVMRTTTTFAIQAGSGTANVYAYLCMRLIKITDVSYYYYQQQVQQLSLGGDRLKVSGSTDLIQAEVCDDLVTVPTLEFHVLVKSGSEAEAAQQCPNSLLFSADYTYYGSDGQTQCASSLDVWDVCTDKKAMTFDYNTCSQQILFSSGGRLWCIFNLNSGYDYTVVFNQDATISTGLSQFACLSVSDPYISVAPGNCTATQTPFDFPKEADGLTSIGHRLILGGKYDACDCQTVWIKTSRGVFDAAPGLDPHCLQCIDCGPEDSGLTPGEIAAIVISVLFVVYTWTAYLIVMTVLVILTLVAAIVFLIVMLYLTGAADGARPVPKLQLPTLYEEKPEATDIKAVPTTPTDVLLLKNGGPKVSEEIKLHKGSSSERKAPPNPRPAVHPNVTPRKQKLPHTSRT